MTHKLSESATDAQVLHVASSGVDAAHDPAVKTEPVTGPAVRIRVPARSAEKILTALQTASSRSIHERYLDEKWSSAASRLAVFKVRTGAWPDRYSGDSEESYLGIWRANQKVLLRDPCSNQKQARCLTLSMTAPGWDETASRSSSTFAQRVSELEAFKLRTGRFPQSRGSDAAERQLARWVLAQAKWLTAGSRGKQYSETRSAAMSGVDRDWVALSGTETSITSRAAELIQYVRSNDGYPEASTSLGSWVRARQNTIERRLLRGASDAHKEVTELLSAGAPGWLVSCQTPARFRAQLNEMLTYVSRWGRLPQLQNVESYGSDSTSEMDAERRAENVLALRLRSLTELIARGHVPPEHQNIIEKIVHRPDSVPQPSAPTPAAAVPVAQPGTSQRRLHRTKVAVVNPKSKEARMAEPNFLDAFFMKGSGLSFAAYSALHAQNATR